MHRKNERSSYRQSRRFLSDGRVATQTLGHCLSENSSGGGGVANSGPMIQKLFRGLRIIGRDLNIRVDPPTKSDLSSSFLLFVNPLIELRRNLVGTENFNNKTVHIIIIIKPSSLTLTSLKL